MTKISAYSEHGEIILGTDSFYVWVKSCISRKAIILLLFIALTLEPRTSDTYVVRVFNHLNHAHTAIFIPHCENIVVSGPLQIKQTTVLLQQGQEAPR